MIALRPPWAVHLDREYKGFTRNILAKQ